MVSFELNHIGIRIKRQPVCRAFHTLFDRTIEELKRQNKDLVKCRFIVESNHKGIETHLGCDG